MECVDNNPVRAGAQLFSDGGQFLHAAKGSNPRCRFQTRGIVERARPGEPIGPTPEPAQRGAGSRGVSD